MAVLAAKGPASRRMLFEVRCERGAEIARTPGFSPATAHAIRSMDEHWDGGGYPDGLRRDGIPQLGRIVGLAQVAEIFASDRGPDHAATIVRQRKGSWFDPEIVDAFLSIVKDESLWQTCASPSLDETVASAEPEGRAIEADESRLNDIAVAFAWVIDAKSPYTYHHSERVAECAVAIGRELGVDDRAAVRLRRAGLLHDIGKLSVPNRILDKPGKLTPPRVFPQSARRPALRARQDPRRRRPARRACRRAPLSRQASARARRRDYARRAGHGP
jgi:putative nucleotidyltransferase with HDIG domain